MKNWKTTFPGHAAADYLRKWVDERIRELEERNFDKALSELRREPWVKNYDLNGVPTDVLDEYGISVQIARRAMTQQPADAAMAVNALLKARALVTP
jgi:hypothetical protein